MLELLCAALRADLPQHLFLAKKISGAHSARPLQPLRFKEKLAKVNEPKTLFLNVALFRALLCNLRGKASFWPMNHHD